MAVGLLVLSDDCIQMFVLLGELDSDVSLIYVTRTLFFFLF